MVRPEEGPEEGTVSDWSKSASGERMCVLTCGFARFGNGSDLASNEPLHSDADESRARFRTRAFVAVTVGCYVLVSCLEHFSLTKFVPAVILAAFLAALWLARDVPSFLWRTFNQKYSDWRSK